MILLPIKLQLFPYTCNNKVAAVDEKLSRYASRFECHRQNQMFVSDQHRYYKQLSSDVGPVSSSKLPNGSDVVDFWSTLWGDTTPHNAEASWIPTVESFHSLHAQEGLTVTPRLVTTVAKKLNKWKSPGPDCAHNFWMNHLTNLHSCLASQIQAVVDGEVPDWLTFGRTVLILKNKAIGAEVVINYWPITCLSNIWKLITSIISKSIVIHLNSNDAWPWEQKGCKHTVGAEEPRIT